MNPVTAIGKGQTDEVKVFNKAIMILKKFHVVTANSKILVELLKPHIPDIVYVPNGVDSSFFTPAVEKSNRKKITIGCVGKKKAAKNYDLIKKLKPIFAGNNIEFRELALQKDSRLIKSHNDVREFYRSLDYYLCTSWHEGTPNPALEAASCGIPVITTRVGNMPDLVRHAENGFFIEPDIESAMDIIEQIKKITYDEYKFLSDNIRNEIVNEWDWSKRIEKHEEVYRLFYEK